MKQLALGSWEWFCERANGSHARAWLFVLSFSESSFFIIPPEVLMIAILMADGTRWLWCALYTSFASILGAIFGYAIAYLFFDTIGAKIISLYGLTTQFEHVGTLFSEHAFWSIFAAAFTPIPFKVFVLAAGFFKINFITFIIASILGRTLRYVMVAYVVYRFGPIATKTFLAYSNRVTWILVGIAAVVACVWYFFVQR